MDIQKEKFIKRFKSTFVYDLLSETLTDEQLFEHIIDTNGDIIWFKDQTRQMWFMWQAAQKVAVPDGFVLLSHEDIARLMNTIDFLGVKALGDEYISFSEIHKIVEEWQEQNKAMIEAQEPAHD